MFRTSATAIGMLAALIGCSGGGSSGGGAGAGGPSSVPPPGGEPPPPPPPTANADTGGGMWWGVLDQGEVDIETMCLLVESGELACFVSDPGPGLLDFDNVVAALHGNVQFSSTNQATGSGKAYATPGHVLTDGTSAVADFTITGGSLNEDNTLIELTFSALGEESTFYGFYDHYYHTVGDGLLWWPWGVYTDFDVYGDPASLTIDDDGTLFLQTASGCLGDGRMVNINPSQKPGQGGYNAYTVDVTVSNCPGLDGDYEGLATLTDFAWVNGTDDLAIAVFSGTTAIVGQAVK